jgi:hypothetical protein
MRVESYSTDRGYDRVYLPSMTRFTERVGEPLEFDGAEWFNVAEDLYVDQLIANSKAQHEAIAAQNHHRQEAYRKAGTQIESPDN